MSPRKMEDILDELEAEGADALAGELRTAWDASPLRRSNEEFKAQAEAALAEAKRYQQVVAGQRFKEFGIKVRPEHLRTPDDLDWADESKVKEWATSAGLIEVPDPNATTPEVDGHARVVDAALGAAANAGRPDMHEALANAKSEAEVMALLRGAGVPTAHDVQE